MPVHVCVAQGENDLPDETVLYRYMPTAAFLHLIESRQIVFTGLTTWPDAYEGFAFEFLNKHRNDPILEGRSRSELYGSCWTLQTEDPRLYSTHEEYRLAQEDLQGHGSAPMWESYCKNGGVRIRTTLGKLTTLFKESLYDSNVFRGKVCYTAHDAGLQAAMSSAGSGQALFIKRVAFRYEAEYRYILLPKDPSSSNVIAVPADELYDFLDEILVAPATQPRTWVARTVYNLGVGIASGPGKGGANHKNGRQFCRISQLYGVISQTIGFP